MKLNQSETLREKIARAGGRDIGPVAPQFFLSATGPNKIKTERTVITSSLGSYPVVLAGIQSPKFSCLFPLHSTDSTEFMTHNQPKTEYRDPKSLRLHKLRKHFPAIDKEAADWIALTDSISATGVLQPLLITAEGFIADGGWRWEAAKDWQLKEVPVQIIAEEMVGVVIAESLIARKQMTRGATVYLMMPIIKEVVMSSELRRLHNLKHGRKTNEIELNPQCFSNASNSHSGVAEESIKNLCFRWGIGKDTYRKARLVWQWLNEPDFAALKKLHVDLDLAVPAVAELRQLQEDLKLDLEHQLLTGEKNLWNVESGIKGQLTGGAHEPPQKQLELFGDALDSLAVRAERFASPASAVPEIRKWIRALETELCEHKGRPVDEFLAKISSVAETCEVTHKTIREFLKAHKPEVVK